MQEKREFNYMNLLLILVFLVGLGILLYPNISNYFNERNSSKATTVYDETVAQMNEEKRVEIKTGATNYNTTLLDDPIGRFADMTNAQYEEYMSQLNIDGSGMMCYLKIDKLGVNLPVYHGTTEEVLQRYVGHVEGTSLPIGGLGTHCALSGHRGLPSAVLFTNLDRMEVGDYFTIIVVGEEHVYQVDQITTVLPDDLSPLEIDPHKDYCTLITCTPYGVNTHRLMVRGVRVPDEEVESVMEASTDSKWFDFTREQIVNIIAVVMILALLGVLLPIFIFPVVPSRKVVLRPWDDNIEKVISAAIAVSEHSTRANWETEDVTREADRLAKLRRWDDTMTYKEQLSEEDTDRPWNDYQYEDDIDTVQSEEEQKNYREWDNDVLEKVDQDWEPIDRVAHKRVLKYSDVVKVVERGTPEEQPENLKPYFEEEIVKGKEILNKSKRK